MVEVLAAVYLFIIWPWGVVQHPQPMTALACNRLKDASEPRLVGFDKQKPVLVCIDINATKK